MIRNTEDRQVIINLLIDCEVEMQEVATEAASRLAELRQEADGYRTALRLPRQPSAAPAVVSAAL